MSKRTWIILGATSIIAKEFAHIVAEKGNTLILVGRDKEQLAIMTADINLRYHVYCEFITVDFGNDINPLIRIIEHQKDADLFIAHSLMLNNDELSQAGIAELLAINNVSTIQLIHAYWQKKQTQHHLIYLSSVAGTIGRSKNSLYGASKAAVEVYLEGLQQQATPKQQITIARLGFIDTHLTYGLSGVFYASPPKQCAKACWNALLAKKCLIYHPFFWRYIMGIMTHLPFFIYKRMRNV